MAIVITKQPVSVAANVNDTVSITLEATGDGLVYDWQYSTNGTKFYSISASASASNWTHDQPTLTFMGYSGYLKYYFRCKITDANGDSVFSNIVRVINLAEAGAGFILPETMHSLAEVIRAKTETSTKMYPSEMADMILAIETGNPEFMTEGEYVELTLSSDTTVGNVEIPCSMEQAPTKVIFFGKVSGSTPVRFYVFFEGNVVSVKKYSTSNVNIAENQSITKGSGYIKLPAANGTFSSGVKYRIYMWR